MMSESIQVINRFTAEYVVLTNKIFDDRNSFQFIHLQRKDSNHPRQE
jgi:hypothetical protein